MIYVKHATRYALVIAAMIAGTAINAMHAIKYTRIAKRSHRVPKKIVVRHACCLNERMCLTSLVKTPSYNFSTELKNCCSPVYVARQLICGLAYEGDSEKTAVLLESPQLFTATELNFIQAIAQFQYDKTRNARYVEILRQLGKHKPK